MNETMKLDGETSPGVQFHRYRLIGFESHPGEVDNRLALLEATDAPVEETPWRLVDRWSLPLAAEEAWDIEAWQERCRGLNRDADAAGVTLDDSDYPPIPHAIEYEITVRRVAP